MTQLSDEIIALITSHAESGGATSLDDIETALSEAGRHFERIANADQAALEGDGDAWEDKI